MARIGMRHLVWAKIKEEKYGQELTYDTGKLLGRAVSGDLSWERNDNPLYGDDEIAENDNGINGYTLDIGMTELIEATAAEVLGRETVNATGGEVDYYEDTDQEAPNGGCGFIQVLRRHGVTSYRAYWFRKIQFSEESESSATKGETIEWGTPTIHGVGMGVVTDGTGKARFRKIKVFGTESDAIEWLNGLANITAA